MEGPAPPARRPGVPRSAGRGGERATLGAIIHCRPRRPQRNALALHIVPDSGPSEARVAPTACGRNTSTTVVRATKAIRRYRIGGTTSCPIVGVGMRCRTLTSSSGGGARPTGKPSGAVIP